MASPVADTYSALSGVPVYGGRYPLGGRLYGEALLASISAEGALGLQPSNLSGDALLDGVVASGGFSTGPSANTVLVGDSLTAYSYGELHTFTGLNALAGGPLKVIGNIAVASNTVGDVLSRIDNLYTAANPGLAGFGPIGWVILRIGTNNTRGGTAITGAVQTAYQNLIAKCLTYASRVIVMAVPPMGPNGTSSGAGVNSFNAWLSSYCATAANVDFIDDTVTVNDGTGAWETIYDPGDGVHYGALPASQMTIDGFAAFSALVAPYGYSSPLISDPADVYPATTQWITNSFMSGTGGSNSVGTGSVPTGWVVGSSGANTADSSIVAADIDDPDQTPWLRVSPTSVTSGRLQISGSMSGRAVTASDPVALEVIAQIRFNSFDGSKFTRMACTVYGFGNEYLTPKATLFVQAGEWNDTVVIRTACPRPNTKVVSATVRMQIELTIASAFTGSFGSFDIRLASVRG